MNEKHNNISVRISDSQRAEVERLKEMDISQATIFKCGLACVVEWLTDRLNKGRE